MIIESMDRDTKIRRLSPIAILGNPGSDGYIDLVNGPQDFSCCSGYTCAERLSTFFTMVATGQMYEIMFTSVPPQNFRIHMLHNDGGDPVLAKIWFPKQQRYDVYVDDMFREPNNKDFGSSDYALLPPDDSFIPDILTEANGANYFDPNTGHLYLLVKGPSFISIKTQPIVVLKLGMTVPIENFFEENVVANLAGLLGIDPSNIRVTNIVREGSTGRKKRSGDTITEVQFEIGPPPLDNLVEFMPEEYTYTTPAGEVTSNPIYTTEASVDETTTEWIEPAGYLNYTELKQLQVQLANEFQTGNLQMNLDVNGTVESLVMEDPVIPPEEPPPYTSPEERAEVLDLTWAEQSALNNTELLEEYSAKSFSSPDSIAMATDIETPYPLEMDVITPAVSVYARDINGSIILDLGDSSDPWECTVSVISGPGDVQGTTTVDFINGIATFDDIYISNQGSGYQLKFDITYPFPNTVGNTTSVSFDVGARPLGIKITNEPLIVAQGDAFGVQVDIWDMALDEKADPSVLAGITFDCSVSLNKGMMNGTTSITVTDDGTALFDDLMIESPDLYYEVTATCSSPETKDIFSESTGMFHVHDFPETGLLAQSVTSFSYKGSWKKIEDVVKNTPKFELKKCKGCPKTKSFETKSSENEVRFGTPEECMSPIEWDDVICK